MTTYENHAFAPPCKCVNVRALSGSARWKLFRCYICQIAVTFCYILRNILWQNITENKHLQKPERLTRNLWYLNADHLVKALAIKHLGLGIYFNLIAKL